MAQTTKESTEEHKDAVAEKVAKPNREAFEKELEELNEKVKQNKAIVEEVNGKFEKMKEEKEKASENKKETPEEAKLKELRAVTKGLGDTRQGLLDQLKKSKDSRQQLHEVFETKRKQVRDMSVTSLDHLEKKVRELEFTMSTTSMSLREERTLMQDIKNLNANKKIFGEVDEAKKARDAAEAKSKEIKEKLDEMKGSYEKARAEEDAAYKVVSKQRDSKKGKRQDVPGMIERRNKARDELKVLFGQINKIRTEFRAKEDAWRKVENERWREKKEKAKADYESRKEEQRLRQLEKEEESFETMNADKLASIDQLTTYLKSKMTAPTNGAAEPASEEAAKPAENEEKLIGKMANRLEDDLFGTKKAGKKKGGKKGKKQQSATMSHDLNVLQEFSTLKLSPPLALTDIPEAIEQLEKKREELKKDKETQWAKYLVKKEKALADVANKKEGEEETPAKEDAPAAETSPAEAAPAAVTAAE